MYKNNNLIKLETKTSETDCSNNNDEICTTKEIIESISNFIVNKTKNKNKKRNNKEIINEAKKIFNCESEACVLQQPELKTYIDENKLLTSLEIDFKPSGPKNNLNLLNNINIDSTLVLWARNFDDFYPCPFTMIDFDKVGIFKFGNINLLDLVLGNESYDDPIYGKINKKFNCFGCVLNTDVSTGRGKHWVCIFANLGYDRNNPWTIEYFNSTGNIPPKTVIKWMEKQRINLLNVNKNIKTVNVSFLVHQKSMTECGLYSLYYIRARLDKIPYEYFLQNYVDDHLMTKFRKHVFRNDN